MILEFGGRKSILMFTESVEMRLSEIKEKVLIISDRNIYRLYPSVFEGRDFVLLEEGEENKNLDAVNRILCAADRADISRFDYIIAFGGGVITDVAGFAASVYKRGTRLIMIPTTLISMIDSSVGGKNGVNASFGKNQIGTFYQPNEIWVNPRFLDTLPEYELKNGFGELIKYALLSKEIYDYVIDKSYEEILENIGEVIYKCIDYKKSIVEKDVYDTGIRRVLNLGHTYGHAVEFAYRINHGYAILMGMLYVLKNTPLKALLELVDKFEINLKHANFNDDVIKNYLLKDKKAAGGVITIVDLEDIGVPVLREQVLEKNDKNSEWEKLKRETEGDTFEELHT